ncbi:serine/threonine-protein kinase Nek2 [Dorcoceras hygrometricum]|uniref:Serine/threonine-protein kinase Nek2 n=1 Tax=Dorcoceras hygrometricum TaxID=472368 RepID=A0A2Z7D7F9_9LAMI|nr:serine/threonine-protein kinase Nek2 [Dorcoceras hygrometricum]
MSTLVNGTVAGDRWIERSGFVVLNAGYCSCRDLLRALALRFKERSVSLCDVV